MSKEKFKKEGRMSFGTESFLGRIIWMGVYLALFLVPLIAVRGMFFPFTGPRSIYFMAFSQVIFFAWLALAIHSSRYRPQKNSFLIILILFIISVSLSALLGVDPSRSFWSSHERMTGILMLFHLFAFFLVCASFFKKREEWHKLISVSCISASLVSLINLGDVLGIFEILSTQAGSTLGNTSFMGTYLLLNVFLAFYLFLKSEGGFKALSGIYFFIISLGLIFNQGGRAALGSFVIGLILFFVLWIALNKKGILRGLAVISLIVALAIGLIGFFFITFSSYDFSRNVLDKANLGTIGGRTVVWEKAWEGFKERPLLGWGPENFEMVFYKHYNPCMGTELCGADLRYDRAHNIIFDHLTAVGLLGTILFISIPLSLIFFLWRVYFKEKRIEFWEPAIVTVIFIAYFIQGLTVFDVMSSNMMLFFIFAFGFHLLQKDDFEKEAKERKMNWLAMGIIAVILLASFSRFVSAPYVASFDVILAQRAETGTKEKVDLHKKALQKTPLGDYRARAFLADDLIDFTKGEEFGIILADPELRENLFESFEFIISELEESVESSPLDFFSFLRLGKTYNAYYVALRREENVSQTQEMIEKSEEALNLAEAALQKAIELSPKNQLAHWELVQNKIYRIEIDEAFSLALEVVELEPQLFQSHLTVIRIAGELLADKELAAQMIKNAIEINPLWELAFQQY